MPQKQNIELNQMFHINQCNIPIYLLHEPTNKIFILLNKNHGFENPTVYLHLKPNQRTHLLVYLMEVGTISAVPKMLFPDYSTPFKIIKDWKMIS
jgi:hypothetical protein